jgi:hypothetical protein
MEQPSRDLARIVGCCIDFRDEFVGSADETGTPVLEVTHRGGVFTVVPGRGDYFVATTTRALSNVEDYPITESEPIVQVDQQTIQDIADGVRTASIELTVETDLVADEGIEYFDGYTAKGPLYVDEQFGLREFDTTLTELDAVCRRAFSDTVDALDISPDVEDAAGSDDDDSTPTAFQ